MFSLALFIPCFAFGDEVEGSVQSYKCVAQGKVCPAGKEIPMAALEKVFVILTTGRDYYFVPNLDPAVFAGHINDHVRVKGTLSSSFSAILADSVEVFKDGKWTKMWGWPPCGITRSLNPRILDEK